MRGKKHTRAANIRHNPHCFLGSEREELTDDPPRPCARRCTIRDSCSGRRLADVPRPDAGRRLDREGIIAPWPKKGLKKLWECELGIGYAPPVVAGGKLYHFDRFEDNAPADLPRRRHRQATVEVRVPDASTRIATATNPARGLARWSTATASTSTVLEGMLHCLKPRRRQAVCGRWTPRRSTTSSRTSLASAASPLVDGDLLIVPDRRQREGAAADRLPRREAQRHRHRRLRQEDRRGEVRDRRRTRQLFQPDHRHASAGRRPALYFARSSLSASTPRPARSLFQLSVAGARSRRASTPPLRS